MHWKEIAWKNLTKATKIPREVEKTINPLGRGS